MQLKKLTALVSVMVLWDFWQALSLGQVFLQVLQFFSVSIIPPMHHIHSYHPVGRQRAH
jgi:hypothetical protein